MTVPRTDTCGEIRRDAVYRLDEALNRLGWGRKTLSTAKRLGLPVLKLGRSGYLRGSDILAVFDRLADDAQE